MYLENLPVVKGAATRYWPLVRLTASFFHRRRCTPNLMSAN